jgi:hypothetical protein
LTSNIASKQLGFFNEPLKVFSKVTIFQSNEDVGKQAPSMSGLLLCAKRNKHHQSN